MNGLGVVVAGRSGVVVVGAEAGLLVATSKGEGGTVEGSAEDGKVSLVQVRAGVGERTRVATPDILGGGLVVRELITSASHNIPADSASLLTELGLSVKRSRGVLSPDGVDVRLPVVGKAGGIEIVVAVGRQDTNDRAVSGGHALLVPGEVIGGGLSTEIRADGVGTARLKTTGNLGRTVVVLHGHTKNQTDKVDVRDVGIERVVGVQGELDETPVNVG